ncbi:MAG: LacI family DNA-binding transcriptional regulator [Rhodanobacteraceae bacterium]
MGITIKDVAKAAGVSVASVSRALNGHDNVTAETRQRITTVARGLRYVPHSAARSLVTRRTQTIGALLPDLFGEFFSELIRGIDLAARARGLHLLVSSSHGDANEAAAALRAMQGRVDGLLIMSPHVDAAFLDDHLHMTLPAVLMNTTVQAARYATLNIDNHGGAFAMTQHLLKRGHRDIAFIGGPDGNFDASERLAGFRAALTAHGGKTKSQVLTGDFSEESGYRAGQQLLAMAKRPQTVFAANDMMAIGCLFALNQAGVRVPQDIALTGFDDIPIARYVSPPLTTVRVRIADLGQGALEQLVARMETPDAPIARARTLSCEIVVRASCGLSAGGGTHKHNMVGRSSRHAREFTGGES